MTTTAMNDGKYRRDAADQSFDYMFKLLIIGNSSVGKTSFLFRYADNSFTSAFVSTVGIDFKVKTVFRQDKRVKLQIWVRHSGYSLVYSCAVTCAKRRGKACSTRRGVKTYLHLFARISHAQFTQYANN